MTINMLITLKQALIELFFSRTHFASEALVRRRRRRLATAGGGSDGGATADGGGGGSSRYTYTYRTDTRRAPHHYADVSSGGPPLKTAVRRLHYYIPALAFVFPLLPFFVASSYITVWRIIDD